jgi:hypothetical protein
MTTDSTDVMLIEETHLTTHKNAKLKKYSEIMAKNKKQKLGT